MPGQNNKSAKDLISAKEPRNDNLLTSRDQLEALTQGILYLKILIHTQAPVAHKTEQSKLDLLLNTQRAQQPQTAEKDWGYEAAVKQG